MGRAFAKCIATAGGTVVINATGANDAGETTANEIRAAGGEAVYIPGRVEDAEALIAAVVDRCGRLDAVVHNAGFVQDKTLRKMSAEQWRAVLDVHLTSAFALSKAAWPHFEAAVGGRLVFISSASGLYGNFGQSNYAAAKAGMHGLCRTIALEGVQSNICCNTVAPFGATEMNSAAWDDARKAILRPEYVAPLIGYLAHPDCTATGGLFEASAGVYKQVRWERSRGLHLDVANPLTIADIATGWDAITDFSETEHPSEMRESLAGLYESQIDSRNDA